MSDSTKGKNAKPEQPTSAIQINPELTRVTDMSGLHVKNVMEDVVWQKIESILSHMDDCCKCSKCKNDIMAITLNNVQAKYVASKQGEMYSRISMYELQNDTRLSAIITAAIMFVKDHPRH